MPKPPPLDELEFIKLTQNHGEYSRKLKELGQPGASSDVIEHAQHVGLCWLRLALEQLDDARASFASKRPRCTYSRSYYSIYNASKSVRYIVSGLVSLKGDDHHKASDLPDDFPDVENWTSVIGKLYEHRLLADYDNWATTLGQLSVSEADAVNYAEAFLAAARQYLDAKYGITP